MSSDRSLTGDNRLIAALPAEHRTRLLTHCESVNLAYGEVLVQSGERTRHVYFPTRSFISAIAGNDESGQIEVGLVGDEGVVGASLLLGVEAAPVRVLVQGAGPALRLRADVFVLELERNRALRESVGRYLYILMDQLTRTAICVRYHLAEARLARWLLMTRDRAHANTFHITHEFLAYMLAVRRAGVTEIAHGLAARGVIEYQRGEVRILDPAALISASCECYQQSIALYARVLGGRKPTRPRASGAPAA